MKRKSGSLDTGPRRSRRIAEMHLEAVATPSQAPPEAGFDQQDAMDWKYDADPARHERTLSLVSLPAELRNRIYEYILTEKRHIHITPQLRVPTLLHVSRQIRAEARLMWFKVNTFQITVLDLDAKLVHAWCRNISPRNLGRGPRIAIHPSHNWANLLEWCQRRHSGVGRTWSLTVSSSDPSLKTNKTRIVAATALQIARTYRELGATWDDCKKALENHRYIVGAFDGMWIKEN